MAEGFFVSADSKEAMSNWVIKPELWIRSLHQSPQKWALLVCKLEPVIVRVAVPILASVAAMMDSFYNFVWFSAKLLVVSVRGTIQVLTQDRWGHFAKDVTLKDVGTHLYKSTAYFGAIFAAPVVGMVAPAKLVEVYRKGDLVFTERDKGRCERIMDAIKQKVQDFKAMAQNQPVFTGVAAVTVASALTAIAIQIAHGKRTYDPTNDSWVMNNPVSCLLSGVALVGVAGLTIRSLAKSPANQDSRKAL